MKKFKAHYIRLSELQLGDISTDVMHNDFGYMFLVEKEVVLTSDLACPSLRLKWLYANGTIITSIADDYQSRIMHIFK